MGRFQYRERQEILGIYSEHGRLLMADLVTIWKSLNSETYVSGLFERVYHAGKLSLTSERKHY